MQVVLELLRTGPYLGGYGIKPHEMLTSKKYSTQHISADVVVHIVIILSSSMTFSFHLKRSVCDTQKVRTMCLRPGLSSGPGWGSSRRCPDPVVGWRGGHPSPIPTPPRRLASRYRRLQRLISLNPSELFLHTALVAQLYFRALDSRRAPSRGQGSYSRKQVVRTIEQRSYGLRRRYDATYSPNVSQTVIVS